MTAIKSLKITFENRKLCDFGHITRKKFKALGDRAITKFLPFTSTYIDEEGFSEIIDAGPVPF